MQVSEWLVNRGKVVKEESPRLTQHEQDKVLYKTPSGI